jgi:chitinase
VRVPLIPKSGLLTLIYSWEYPTVKGIGCNTVSANDSTNFLEFLKLFRDMSHPRELIISAAVSLTPFADPTGAPMKNVTDFANVLDHIGSSFPIFNLAVPLCLTASHRDYEL